MATLDTAPFDSAPFDSAPFDSDDALDFLAEVARREPDVRAKALAHMFSFVVGHPELLGHEFFPDEIVAAAAIVAASMPGGERIEQRLLALTGTDIAANAILPMPCDHLAWAALDALRLVPDTDELAAVLSGAAA